MTQRSTPPRPPSGLLARLSSGARTGLFLGALAVVLGALFAPGVVGAVLIGVIVVALGWLMTHTWVVTSPRNRVVRVTLLVAFVALAAYKINH